MVSKSEINRLWNEWNQHELKACRHLHKKYPGEFLEVEIPACLKQQAFSMNSLINRFKRWKGILPPKKSSIVYVKKNPSRSKRGRRRSTKRRSNKGTRRSKKGRKIK